MELRDIRYFTVVAEKENIGRTAEALGLSAVLKAHAKGIEAEGAARTHRSTVSAPRHADARGQAL